MIHPHTQVRFISERVGLGLVATQPIPAGTLIWIRDSLDRLISSEDAEPIRALVPDRFDAITFHAGAGSYVLLGDASRFTNHSCEPTSMWLRYPSIEVAVRDIAPGEQITDDYSSLCLTEDQPYRCQCQAPTCRGVISPDDVTRMLPIWENKVRQVASKIGHLPQPLFEALSTSDRSRAESELAAYYASLEEGIDTCTNGWSSSSPPSRLAPPPPRGSSFR